MNKISRYVLVVFVLASMLLGACAGAAPSVTSDGGKVEASSVAYTGTIESINGTQWVVNGQTITVDPSVVNDGPFNVGDLVKVEVQVAQDGTVTVTRVELPSQVDMSQLPGLGDDNSNDANDNDANGNDVNGNDANGNDANGNDDNSNNANGNDSNSNNGNGGNSNSGNEVSGVVEAITTTSVTINGLTYEFQSGVEIKGLIQAGDFVKIHLVQNADGTFSVREMELSDPSQVGNGNDSNSNDGNGNGNDDNSNSNSNDDDDNDDNDGNGNGDDNDGQGGGNDNGGNGNG